MDIRTREAVRYLGYGRHEIDERTLLLIEECFKELEKIAEVRFIHRIFEINFLNESEFKIGTLLIKSKNLRKALKGCGLAALFGITLGTAVDRQMRRYELLDMAKAVVFQACAAAFLEEQCDQIQEKLGQELEKEGLYLRPRYSPGYGDFSILYQKELLQMLETAKKIGVSMTEGYMLIPSKSVTAVIGLSKTKEPCHRKGCEVCSKNDCIYRRS